MPKGVVWPFLLRKEEKMRFENIGMVLCITTFLVVSQAQAAFFQGLGTLHGGRQFAVAVSADGSVVVGKSGNEAFRWNKEDGMVGLGYLPGGSSSFAYGVSSDGSVVVGNSSTDTGNPEAFRWTEEGGMVGLGYLPGDNQSNAYDASADGSVVVGHSSNWPTYGSEAYRWTSTDGMIGLGHLAGGIVSEAWGISNDGSVVVGNSKNADYWEAFRWTKEGGVVGLGHPLDYLMSFATGISADGSVAVGSIGHSTIDEEAVCWKSNGSIIKLGSGFALSCSADGSFIVGYSHFLGESRISAFLWDSTNGMQNLKDILTKVYELDLDGWHLSEAIDISEDGYTIVGYGINPYGTYEAWIANLELSTKDVVIDIKPGTEENCVNINDHGVIPVAIMGTADFDVTQVDPGTCRLQGMSVKMAGKSNKLLCNYLDINNDGYDDLLLIIEDSDGNFVEGQANATLSGNLYDGTPIEGADYICIVP